MVKNTNRNILPDKAVSAVPAAGGRSASKNFFNTAVDNSLNNSPSENDQEPIIQELLRLACDTSEMDKLSVLERINKILDIRIENEIKISKLLGMGLIHDKVSFHDAALINSKSKDSLSDLVKVRELLAGRSTENIKLTAGEIDTRLAALVRMRSVRGRG